MLVKLNSSLQTKNYLGLSDQALKELVRDPYYMFLREALLEPIRVDRKGQVIHLTGSHELKIHRDYMAIVQPNPDLHNYGMLSYNSHLTGHCIPSFTFKSTVNSCEIALDYLYEIRLLK